MRRSGVVLALLLAAALAACTGPRKGPPPVAAQPLPLDEYRDALRRGDVVYLLDGKDSLVTIRVYRAGPLARLGHDHVVASRDIRGLAAWSSGMVIARADLVMPLATLSVDEAELRAAAGLESGPSEEDIAGTYTNMLASLEAQAFPEAIIRVTGAIAVPDTRLAVEVALHGMTRRYDVPVELSVSETGFEVAGAFELLQSEFGIVPYSIFGGALSVADRLDVAFRLRGTRVAEVPATGLP